MEVIETGIKSLDKKLGGGLPRGSFTAIASRPGMGKTAFALQIAGNIAENGYNVIFFSLEMSKDMTLERMAKQGTNNECNIIIDDTPAISVGYIANKVKSCENVDAIIIDYFQLLKSNKIGNYDNRIKGACFVANALKHLAKEMNASVIVTSQLSRPTIDHVDKKPSLLDFQDSRQIVKYADNILFTYLEAYDPEHPETFRKDKLIIAKNNNGKLGDVPVEWHGERLVFEEYE